MMMRRIWRISLFHHLFRNTTNSCDTPSFQFQIIRQLATPSPDSGGSLASSRDALLSLFTDNSSYNTSKQLLEMDLRKKVSKMKDELLAQNYDDVETLEKFLEANATPLFRIYSDGSAVLELLTQLKPFPNLALEVLNWRRKRLNYVAPMTVEEYVKGIVIAGRLQDVNLALELFNEASEKQLNGTSLFNALMSAYLSNNLITKAETLFRKLKTETTDSPSIVTYNILISMYGSTMLVCKMEETLMEIKKSNLTPTLETYKGLISGYMTAWKWQQMEKTYLTMKAGPIKPDVQIHLLMARGYANSGQLEKMEEMYEMIRGHLNHHKALSLIVTMIRAYCRRSYTDRVKKVEELLTLIPADDYRPWLYVYLIALYANEDLLERMEKSINEAFDHKVYITTARMMRCIISSYFRQNAVDKLADFVQRAEHAGWKICRSLYHCKMVMYSSQMRLSEMERVLDEMGRVKLPVSKKTLWILYKAYQRSGERRKFNQVTGMLCKYGFETIRPLGCCASMGIKEFGEH